MASRKVDELPGDAKDLASTSRCGADDITEEPQSDTMNATVKSQKSGKFRRTALTFFGVRKSICILPSFFGGRSKNPSKWSKKGLNKSRTHDGLCKVSRDDNLRSGYTSAGDFEYHSQRDSAGALHSSCHNECSHPAAEQKSLTLTRQKRGLRSLFQSFKYHRNHRNIGLDKSEMIAMSTPRCKQEVPVVQDNTNQYVTECLGSEPDVPDFADVICDISISPECIDADEMPSEKSVEQDSPKSELDGEMCDEEVEELNLLAVVSSELKESSRGHSEPCLKLQMMSEPLLRTETPAGSSDQLNLIYGDVASLKSFDSLTGCGDIIADQEDDSITESTVSGERSRNGGKRASCYLTYQGGGEEMASPEDLDEDGCLNDFWGNNTSEEICCTCNQEHTDLTADLTSSHNMDLLNSNSAQQASGMDASSIADVLTPQSEHQESVPNSDEGYYDSTTPGPDDAQEKTDRLRAERLPRDSYSGDALYELFAPDESLISPHYENKSKLPSSKPCEYLNEPLDVTDSAFVPDMNRLQISAELYEVRDFLEMPGTCCKSPELAQNVAGRQEISMNKNCNLNSKPQASGNKSNAEPDVFDEKGNMPASTERTKSINADCEKRHSSVSFGSTSDPDFETFCEPKEQHLEENKPVALPYKNINSQSPDDNSELDDGQTVCFSQALVDYTKHSQMLSNLHNNADDLETNSALTQNMQALPTIVTFDVVDMHNEGEYDEQIHMELEEDISSPYQEFEESYLQKDAFAECDYQMLDLYEQNLISNTWAIASLPRHLGLTRVSQSMPNALSLDRRSRSLDTESLELQMPDAYREKRAACPQTEKDTERDSSPYYKKNVLVSASEVRDSSSIMALSWQTRSEMALSLPLTDGEFTQKEQSLSQTQVKRKIFSSSSSSDCPNSELCSKVSDRVSCDLVSHNTELYNRQCHLPSQSNSCLPHSTFVYSEMMDDESDYVDEEVFCKAASNLQSYNQRGKSRPVASLEGLSPAGSPLNAGVYKEDIAVLGELSPPRDVACNKFPEATFN
ncbi:APC membrane recruitment protein 1-like [Centropristis striata]|uniref:APC membrane recruitment protein 1-like n=1 Tax=Centropristis striata TaxID=184440 RepID=UPI0027E06FC9|nr:APC membrane recruitment protein 1-like [Centropristis striata]